MIIFKSVWRISMKLHTNDWQKETPTAADLRDFFPTTVPPGGHFFQILAFCAYFQNCLVEFNETSHKRSMALPTPANFWTRTSTAVPPVGIFYFRFWLFGYYQNCLTNFNEIPQNWLMERDAYRSWFRNLSHSSAPCLKCCCYYIVFWCDALLRGRIFLALL